MRHAVSVCDVSTLGKMQVSGPGALALVEHLYPAAMATLRPGRSRYALLLDERGYVLDDGLVSRDSETRFTLSFTSGAGVERAFRFEVALSADDSGDNDWVVNHLCPRCECASPPVLDAGRSPKGPSGHRTANAQYDPSAP